MPHWWIFPVVGAFVLSIGLTDLMRFLALKWDVLDRETKERKQHGRPVPYLGGTAIYLAFALPVLLVLVASSHFTSGEMTVAQILGFLLGGLVLIAGGVIDDRYDLPPRVSILFPVIAALIAALAGIGPDKITNPLGGYFEVAATLAFIFTFFWLIGMTYTTKLLDGVDGLASGITLIAALMIAALALTEAYFQPDVSLMALIAAAALLGFLLWNFHPAQIFLGEGGSTYVGYLIGGLAIISGSKVATALLVVGIPILDIIFVLYERWRAGRSLFVGDRAHLHFKLYDLGLSQRQVVGIYYLIALLFGLTTLIFASWQKLLALGVLVILMGLIAPAISKTKNKI